MAHQKKRKRKPSASQTTRSGRGKKKKKTLKNRLMNFFLFLLLIIGLLLVFNGQIKNLLVKFMSNENRIEHLSADDIDKNKTKAASFDFDAVNSLDFETVVKARLYGNNLAVIGGIAVPRVKLNLPIIKGVSNYAISVGAGTMKENQEMGKGNYALASHRMIDRSLLFTPLDDTTMGDKIYLTDLRKIYTYKIFYKEYIDATRVEIIEDVPKKKIVTLITCDEAGIQRLAVQGKLTDVRPVKKATKAMTEAFNLEKNTIYN